MRRKSAIPQAEIDKALHYIEQADKLRLAQQGLERMAARGKEKQG